MKSNFVKLRYEQTLAVNSHADGIYLLRWDHLYDAKSRSAKYLGVFNLYASRLCWDMWLVSDGQEEIISQCDYRLIYYSTLYR